MRTGKPPRASDVATRRCSLWKRRRTTGGSALTHHRPPRRHRLHRHRPSRQRRRASRGRPRPHSGAKGRTQPLTRRYRSKLQTCDRRAKAPRPSPAPPAVGESATPPRLRQRLSQWLFWHRRDADHAGLRQADATWSVVLASLMHRYYQPSSTGWIAPYYPMGEHETVGLDQLAVGTPQD